MRRLLVGIALVCVASPAVAAEQVQGGSNGRIDITDHAAGSEGAAPVAGPGRQVFAYWRLVPTAQRFCRERRHTTDEALARAYDYLHDRRGAEANGADWADGTPPTTTTSRGGPWPDGDVTHVYTDAHTAVTIRVVQLWSATWTAGPTAAGTLEQLRTEGELTIRVDQLQPVRNK